MLATPETLAAALAAGGEITLAEGRYDAISLGRRQGITIRGGPGAIVAGWNVSACQDVAFEGFTVEWTPAAGNTTSTPACRFYNSTNVTARGLAVRAVPVPASVKGALDARADPPPGQNAFIAGLPAGYGLVAATCTGVTFEDCEVSGFFKGVVVTDGEDVIVRRCNIHHQRTTHIGMAGKLKRVLIEKNRLSHSTPWRYANDSLGDHSDAISIRSSAKGGPVTDLTIIDNLIDQDGGYRTLGITLGDNGDVGFVNTVVSGNTVLQAVTQAVTASAKVQGLVTGNVLLHPGGEGESPTAILRGPDLRLEGNTLADVTSRQTDTKKWPGNTWLTPGPQPADVVEAARAAALAKIGATEPVVDPRDAEIVNLKAELDEARATADRLTAERDAMAARIAEAQTVLAG